MQDVFTELTTNGVYIVTNPNQLLAATNTFTQVQVALAAEGTPPGGLTISQTEIWCESLTTTPPTIAGGAGGMDGGGVASMKEKEDVEYLYLELKAKNILPREREDLNKEFAELLASRFRANPLFSDSEEETKITSNIPPGKPEDRWFSFKMQVKLVTPIQMQPPDDGY